jgi:hypothetical protein
MKDKLRNAGTTAVPTNCSEDAPRSPFSRRKFLATTALVAGGAALGLPHGRVRPSPSPSPAGAEATKGIREHFADPFSKETGIEVILINKHPT